jgi:concanavalin A-like lectin/glucanase superfamily protein
VSKRKILMLAVSVPAVLLVAALPAAAASTVVLNYTGDETSGTVAVDSSAYGNNGSLHQVALGGQVYSFNGSTSYIQTPASASINPGTAAFSYAVSINISPTTIFSHDLSLVRRGSSKFAGAYYKMEMVYNKATGTMRLECAFRDQTGARGFVATSGNTLNDGIWHTLTCSKTATTVSLTKDGKTRTNPATLGNMSSTVPLFFGAEQVGATSFWEHFAGQMDDITLTKG